MASCLNKNFYKVYLFEEHILRFRWKTSILDEIHFNITFLFFLLDIASHAAAAQSSKYDIYAADRAIDGFYYWNRCSHTLLEENPFLTLTFKPDVEVYKAAITNRPGYNHRLFSFTIYVGKPGGSMRVCVENKSMTDKDYEEYVCNENPLIGKFVKIILNGTGELTLCEVEIFGRLLWGVFSLPALFSCSRTEYEEIRNTEYLSVFSPNAGKQGPAKLGIGIFSQWFLEKSVYNWPNEYIRPTIVKYHLVNLTLRLCQLRGIHIQN